METAGVSLRSGMSGSSDCGESMASSAGETSGTLSHVSTRVPPPPYSRVGGTRGTPWYFFLLVVASSPKDSGLVGVASGLGIMVTGIGWVSTLSPA